MEEEGRIESINAHFQRVDRQDPSMIDLFTEDAEMWFPKYGDAKGKPDIERFAEVLSAHLRSLTHAIDEFRYYVRGDVIVAMKNVGSPNLVFSTGIATRTSCGPYEPPMIGSDMGKSFVARRPRQ